MSLPIGLFKDDDEWTLDGSDEFTDLVSPPLSESSHNIENSFDQTRQVQGVLVHTNSMMLRANVPQYEKHYVEETDEVFSFKVASISKVMKFELVVRPITTEERPGLAPFLQETQVPNLPLRSLYRNCDITANDATAGPYGWDHEFGKWEVCIDGPVVVARKDKKPLHVLHLQMILEFVDDYMNFHFDDYHRERLRWKKRLDVHEYREKIDEMRGEVEQQVKVKNMKVQWDMFRDKNWQDTPDWEGLKSPWGT